MTKETKITKKDILAAIRVLVEDQNLEIPIRDVTVVTDDILNYVDTTVAQIDAKNAKARERAAEKRAEGDDLANKIADALTDEYQSIPALIEKLNIEDLTPGKVTARLTQLVKADRAHKSKIKVGDRTLNGYAVGPAPIVEDAVVE